MNIKTGALAAAAVLALTVPAAALAQPFYGDRGYAPSYGRDYDRYEFRRDRDGWRRFQWERERERREEWRRRQWQREHAYRYDYGYTPYYR